jgi:hypothetical protein
MHDKKKAMAQDADRSSGVRANVRTSTYAGARARHPNDFFADY